jgi:hypothetical protein
MIWYELYYNLVFLVIVTTGNNFINSIERVGMNADIGASPLSVSRYYQLKWEL